MEGQATEDAVAISWAEGLVGLARAEATGVMWGTASLSCLLHMVHCDVVGPVGRMLTTAGAASPWWDAVWFVPDQG